VATPATAVQDIDRLSVAGAQWRAWQATRGPINVTLYSAGHTFQPAQIDFQPRLGLRRPAAQTQRSFVTGVKADALAAFRRVRHRRFLRRLYNQPVATSGGTAVLRRSASNAKAIDVERMRPAADRQGKRHVERCPLRRVPDRHRRTPTQLAGNHQVLTPSAAARVGLLYAAERGWRASLTSNWVGQHWLNSLNTFEAPAYAVVDASLGYRFERFTLSISGANLGNRRDAVQLSELGEDSFYRMTARRVDATLSWHFK
jgi:outer membrane receptor protein involved in Fe transport